MAGMKARCGFRTYEQDRMPDINEGTTFSCGAYAHLRTFVRFHGDDTRDIRPKYRKLNSFE